MRGVPVNDWCLLGHVPRSQTIRRGRVRCRNCVRMCDWDSIPFHGLSGLPVLVDGQLGEVRVPVRPVVAPGKTELLDEAVKFDREQVVVFPRSQTTPLRHRLLISLSSRRFITNLACLDPFLRFLDQGPMEFPKLPVAI